MGEISMREVAAVAGVSVATVSRTFQMPDQVLPATRDKVLKAAESLGYVYNAAVGDFTGKRSTVLGILVPKIGTSLFGSTLAAIQEAATRKGFSVILGCTDYNHELERRLLKQFQERRLGAVILTGFTHKNEGMVHEMIDFGLPCMVIWEKLESSQISYVGFDNRKAAFTATSHLLDMGHRRIGMIAGPFSLVGRVNKRLIGYRDALEKWGVPYDPDLVIERFPNLIEGRASADSLLSMDNPPTGIFAASDILAIGAMQAISERGLNVPRDISVVGFDDIEFAAFMNPPLSSVRVDAVQIGRLAVEIAIEMATDSARIVRQYCLDTDLILRGSSGPCLV